LEISPKKLRSLRLDRNISLKDIATILGLKTPGGYSRIETGENKLKAEHLPLLAAVFNMDLTEFVAEIFFEEKLEHSSNIEENV
jgi:transcriptional regulator with XRE-family HTH domain